MLFSLLLANITILLCLLFLFLVVFNNFLFFYLFFLFFFGFSAKIENAKLKLDLTIPTGAPITVANDAIEMLLVLTDKAINDLSK